MIKYYITAEFRWGWSSCKISSRALSYFATFAAKPGVWTQVRTVRVWPKYSD